MSNTAAQDGLEPVLNLIPQDEPGEPLYCSTPLLFVTKGMKIRA